MAAEAPPTTSDSRPFPSETDDSDYKTVRNNRKSKRLTSHISFSSDTEEPSSEKNTNKNLNTQDTDELDYRTDDTSDEENDTNDTLYGRPLTIDIPTDRETQEDNQTTSPLQ